MGIAKLRHRVHLCSQQDVITDGELRLNRKGVLSMWAVIETKGASAFSPTGAAMNESRSRRTHVITTRYHHDLDISSFAWLYEERRKSTPRWFKILRVSVTEQKGSQYFMFECRLVESKEDVPVPEREVPETLEPVCGLPEGLKL